MLKILFSNTKSIEERMKQAIDHVLWESSKRPGMPDESQAFYRGNCHSCGRIEWFRYTGAHTCGQCQELQLVEQQLRVETQKMLLADRRELLDRIRSGDREALAIAAREVFGDPDIEYH